MPEPDDNDVQIFIQAMRKRSCYDFSNYSMSSLKRRIWKVLTDNNMNIHQLADSILSDWSFTEKIVRSITVCTTELFRDPALWISIRDDILSSFTGKDIIRVWHAGCSTGQEVYSMMILLNELNMLDKSEIYASDINTDVLALAKQGIYKYRFNKVYLENFDRVFRNDLLPAENMKVPYEKYFTVNTMADEIRMLPFLTEKPVYKKSDLVNDENPFRVIFDIIVCRNVIIYFNFELQNKVFNLFYRNLNDYGRLVLGAHETIIGTYTMFFNKNFHSYYKIPKK